MSQKGSRLLCVRFTGTECAWEIQYQIHSLHFYICYAMQSSWVPHSLYPENAVPSVNLPGPGRVGYIYSTSSPSDTILSVSFDNSSPSYPSYIYCSACYHRYRSTGLIDISISCGILIIHSIQNGIINNIPRPLSSC